jgi:hypothetical protein
MMILHTLFRYLLLGQIGYKNVKKILFEQNPIQCDCNLAWILNKKMYSDASVTLPEICAGPKGYDCLRISDLSPENLPCPGSNVPSGKVFVFFFI